MEQRGIADIVITGATVIDGTGMPAFQSDIAIRGDRIEKVAPSLNVSSHKVIDACGKVVCPGFIDIHGHSDYHLLINPRGESKIRQGVTTEVGGNCGYAAAPIGGEALRERRRLFRRQFGLDLPWQSLVQFRQVLEDRKISVNYIPLVGHNTIRASVMGLQNRPPTVKEMQDMSSMIDEAMQEGAYGLSSGLIYPPACYASPSELTVLCSVVARYGGYLSCHIRNEGPRLLEALEEVLSVARDTPISLQIAHLKTAGEKNWHKLPQVFALIEKARNHGVSVTADRYPYIASHTGLSALLPDWAFEGGIEEQLRRLRDRSVRRQLEEEILQAHPKEKYWDTVLLSELASVENRRWIGRTVADAARSQGKRPVEFLLDLLIQEEMQAEALYFIMSERNLRSIISKPYVMIGSDSACRADYGPLGNGKPHPRSFGTFPRVLRYSLRRKIPLSLEETVHKMTLASAKKVDLKDRGIIREGYMADLVMFDPRTVADTATYQDPIRYPVGIECVIVNGAVTIERGMHTGALQGRVLKRGA